MMVSERIASFKLFMCSPWSRYGLESSSVTLFGSADYLLAYAAYKSAYEGIFATVISPTVARFVFGTVSKCASDAEDYLSGDLLGLFFFCLIVGFTLGSRKLPSYFFD